MRRPQIVSLAVAVLSAGMVLTACGGGSGKDSASATDGASKSPSATATPGTTDTSSASPADDGGSADPASTADPAKSGSSGGSSQAPDAGKGSGGSTASERCHTAGLSFAIAPGSGAQSVGSAGPVIITMTNHGSRTCTMKGYPGIDLTGAGQTWSLSRQTSVTPHLVTLRPGGRTTFTITYLPYAAGDGRKLDVKTIVITPPNETTSAKVAWEFQPVLLQDGATHPGTYVGPVGDE
ncbi:DUF4232 domain-containing protein [Streptomyces sp. NPDC020917]|uniref:DUF4232 domain-containing protein n=1 Tax=Streptomyces sp. NPDC020917 TaxID=3365102 RepID=UPI0037B488A5